jgi:hypothetical protein
MPDLCACGHGLDVHSSNGCGACECPWFEPAQEILPHGRRG